jgi:hypothetical protein
MSATTDHPCFCQPANEDEKVWRYMDFTKFVSLIATRSLFFCRSDLLGDPFEGSYPKRNIELRPQFWRIDAKDCAPDLLAAMTHYSRWQRLWTYVNCWHLSSYESAAMWKLYCRLGEAIAIQATYRSLVSVLPPKTLVGLVRYIDYDTGIIPEANTFYPFVHKRRSFEHEREVRGVIQELPTNDNKVQIGEENPHWGVSIGVDLHLLIETIYVAPTSPPWYFELVQEMTRKYSVARPVVRSSLDEQPVW